MRLEVEDRPLVLLTLVLMLLVGSLVSAAVAGDFSVAIREAADICQ